VTSACAVLSFLSWGVLFSTVRPVPDRAEPAEAKLRASSALTSPHAAQFELERLAGGANATLMKHSYTHILRC